MTIRPIKEADIPSIVEMIRLNWDRIMAKHHSPAVVEKFRGEVTPDWVRRQMGWKQVFVVDEGGAVLATGALANFGTIDSPKHSVSQFFVRPDLHARGIGTHLLNHLVQVARGGGVRYLHVPSSRNAIRFYQHAGFVVDPAQPDVSDEITWMRMNLQDQSQNYELMPNISFQWTRWKDARH